MFTGESVCLLVPGAWSVTTSWLRVSSQGKAPSPGSGAAPGGPTQGSMEKSTWNRGLSLFGGMLYGSRVWGPVVATTGLHLPVALLFGMVSLRGAQALPTSHTASAECSYGLKEAVTLARLSSLPTRPGCPFRHLAPSTPGRGVRGLFSYFTIVPNFTEGIAQDMQNCSFCVFDLSNHPSHDWIGKGSHCVAAACQSFCF